MESMVVVLSIILVCDYALSSTPCSKSERRISRRQCLNEIKRRALSRTEFWFGTQYAERCPGGPTSKFECLNPNFDRNAVNNLVSTITGSSNPRFLSRVDRFLEIKYKREPGSYQACGNTYRVPDSKDFTIDPTSTEIFRPFDVRAQPEVRWRTRYGENLFTLILVDSPLGNIVHWVVLNIKDNDVMNADALFAYAGSLNPFPIDNPYIFLLFKQTRRIRITDKLTAEFAERDPDGFKRINVPSLMRRFRLKGPASISWMKIRHDPFSIQAIVDAPLGNFCPFLVSEALNGLNREFVPPNTELTVSVDVTYHSPPIKFTSCCNIVSIPTITVELNPIGDGMVNTALCRQAPKITLLRQTVFPDASNFEGKLYTLLLVSPDGNGRTRSRPFIRWMMTNIQNGNVAGGDQVLSYNGCVVRGFGPRFHFFILYEQTNKILDADPFLNPNCNARVDKRCLFDIGRFTRENGLRLVGASWMVTKEDEFSRFSVINDSGFEPNVACSGRGLSGFDLPCPNGLPVAALLNK